MNKKITSLLVLAVLSLQLISKAQPSLEWSTSAGAATISFDRIVGAVTTVGFYLVANPIANFVTTAGNEVLPGVDFNANPLLTSASADSSVGITIGVAALTAGRIQIILNLQMTDDLS